MPHFRVRHDGGSFIFRGAGTAVTTVGVNLRTPTNIPAAPKVLGLLRHTNLPTIAIKELAAEDAEENNLNFSVISRVFSG